MKWYLNNLPLLSPSKEGEDLLLYLVVSTATVSTTLIREEQMVQCPVYYISQAFQGVEAKYPCMEKITLALVMASRKLCLYFSGEFDHSNNGPVYQESDE